MTGSSCRSSCVVHRVASVEHGVSSGQVEYSQLVLFLFFIHDPQPARHFDRRYTRFRTLPFSTRVD